MLEIIQKLFVQANFETDQIEPDFKNVEEYFNHHSFFAKISNDNKFDFFLVIEIRKFKIIQKHLQAILDIYFEHIIKTNNEYGIDKNLSLVILIEEDSVILEKDLKSFVYDLEEDPFDFKKHVILYTNKQKVLLQKQLSSNDNFTEELQNILQNKEMFTWYKHNQHLQAKDETTILYDIVSKLFIKLHFLTLQINPLNLSNLKQEIENDLSTDELEIRDKIISFNFSEDANTDELLKLLGVKDIEQ